ncbi:MAG TPA: hypothetical protein VEA80_06785 [Vitreimonas sp.]|uniref:hypothetical protein n=1 Tax=Vitreimonas sp. TaxID=3069702 RepID=UPI002D41B60C|nr:hypothetical protein [Vitreimonas sp.]HYD87160.1 hypothetical protein [Vitreimonas sp.]
MSDDPLAPWAKRPPYLQRWIDPRNGAEHVYYRRAGVQKRPLNAPWGTQALADEVGALAAAHTPKPKPEAGTIVGAIREYRGDRTRGIDASADFLALAAATQLDYERLCDEFETTFAGVLLEDIDAGYVLKLRDKWAKRGYRAANLRLQVFKNICKGPRIRAEIAGDPFALIDKVPRPQNLGVANPRWLDEEFEAALEHAIETHRPGLARALALGRWGGFRRQTICSVPRRARIWRDNEDGVRERRLYWVTEKKLVLCDRREDPRLTALLERTEKMRPRFAKNVASLTIAFNSYGEAWKKRALSHAVEDLVAALAKAGRCRPSLTIHGLRHARGVELALAGASDAGIMSQLDHATPRQAAEYRKQAERLGLADAAQDQVDARVTKLRQRRAARGQQDKS